MNDELLAETSVLGSIFIDPNAVPIVLDKLTEFDFQSDTGKAVFRAVQAMYKDGVTIDGTYYIREEANVGKVAKALANEINLAKMGGVYNS